eukprot:1150606-Pelagomonas_calceolata.AAC.2
MHACMLAILPTLPFQGLHSAARCCTQLTHMLRHCTEEPAPAQQHPGPRIRAPQAPHVLDGHDAQEGRSAHVWFPGAAVAKRRQGQHPQGWVHRSPEGGQQRCCLAAWRHVTEATIEQGGRLLVCLTLCTCDIPWA